MDLQIWVWTSKFVHQPRWKGMTYGMRTFFSSPTDPFLRWPQGRRRAKERADTETGPCYWGLAFSATIGNQYRTSSRCKQHLDEWTWIVTTRLSHPNCSMNIGLGTLGDGDDLELKPSMLIVWEDYAGLLWGWEHRRSLDRSLLELHDVSGFNWINAYNWLFMNIYDCVALTGWIAMLVHLLGTFPGWKTQDGSPEESTRYYDTVTQLTHRARCSIWYQLGKWNIEARLSSDISRFAWGYCHRGACVASLCWHFAAFVRRRFTLCGDSRGILPKSFCHFLSKCFILITSIGLLANSKFCTWFWYTNSIKLHQHKKLLLPLHVCCVDSCWWAVALAGHWRPSQGLETCQGLLPLVEKRTRDQFM